MLKGGEHRKCTDARASLIILISLISLIKNNNDVQGICQNPINSILIELAPA